MDATDTHVPGQGVKAPSPAPERNCSNPEADLQAEITRLRTSILRTITELDRFCSSVHAARDAVEAMKLGGSARSHQQRADDKWE